MRNIFIIIVLLSIIGCHDNDKINTTNLKVTYFEGFYEQSQEGLKININDSLKYTFGYHCKIRLDDIKEVDTLTYLNAPATKLIFKEESKDKIKAFYKKNMGNRVAIFIDNGLINLMDIKKDTSPDSIYLYQPDRIERDKTYSYLKEKLVLIKDQM